MFKPFQILCLSAVVAFSVKAQQPALEIKLSSDSITLGNFFTVQIILVNTESSTFIAPVFNQASMEQSYYSKKENNDKEIVQEWIYKVYPYYEGRYLVPKMLFKLNKKEKFEIEDIGYYVFPKDEPNEKVGVVDVKAPKIFSFNEPVPRRKQRSIRSKDKSNVP